MMLDNENIVASHKKQVILANYKKLNTPSRVVGLSKIIHQCSDQVTQSCVAHNCKQAQGSI